MESAIQNITAELAENWPAFTYIVVGCLFSLMFLRERRLETRVVKQIGAAMQEEMRRRFDNLEAQLRIRV